MQLDKTAGFHPHCTLRWAFIYCRLHGPATDPSRKDLLEAGSLPIKVTRELLDAEK